MYCSRCGKQIDYDDVVCKECRAKEEAEKLASQTQTVEQHINAPEISVQAGQNQQAQETNWSQPLDDGKGRAIASVVMGVSSIFWSFIGLCTTSIVYVRGIIFFYIPSLVLAILAVTNGAQSIRTFNQIRKQGGSKPVGTLIMGIVALVTGALALFILTILLTASCLGLMCMGCYGPMLV